MSSRVEESYTVVVTVENVRTGAAQCTRYRRGENGVIKVTEAKTQGGCAAALEILREIVETQENRTPINARVLRERDQPGVWYEVAKKVAEETLCRDGDGNYHLIKSERAGADKVGRAIEQKKSRELMAEDDARYWARENLRMEEYEKAFGEG